MQHTPGSRRLATVRPWLRLCVVIGLSLAVIGAPQRATAAGGVDKAATIKLLMKRADEARKAGKYGKAAGIWHQIYLQLPSEPMSLYNAALMEEKAGDLESASRHLREFLTVATAKHPRYSHAKVRLQAVAAKMEAAEKTKLAERLLAERRAKEAAEKKRAAAQAAAPAPSGPKASAGPSRVPGWVTLGIGGAALATAGTLYGLGVLEDSDIRKKYEAGDLSETEAQDRIDQLQRNDIIYAALGGVGLAAVGVGIYLLARDTKPKRATGLHLHVAPALGGGGLARGLLVGARF